MMFENKKQAEKIAGLIKKMSLLERRVDDLERQNYILAKNKNYNPYADEAMFQRLYNSEAISKIADHLGIQFEYSKGTPPSTSIVKKPKG